MAGGRDPQEELKSAGIQPGSRFQNIIYNRSSQAVLAHFRLGRVGMLYYRKRSSLLYRKVAQPGERTSYEDMVTAAAAPVAFIKVTEFSANSEGADWRSVALLDMRTGKLTPLFFEKDLKPTRPYSRGWVRDLLEAWPDGRGVVCIISFERPATSAEKKRWSSQRGTGELITAGEHWICDLDLKQKTYERLTLLKAMFF